MLKVGNFRVNYRARAEPEGLSTSVQCLTKSLELETESKTQERALYSALCQWLAFQTPGAAEVKPQQASAAAVYFGW